VLTIGTYEVPIWAKNCRPNLVEDKPI